LGENYLIQIHYFSIKRYSTNMDKIFPIRKSLFILSFLLFFISHHSLCFPQNNESELVETHDKADLVFDSLVTKLENETVDTLKINLLNEIAWYYAPINFEKSTVYADSALVRSTEIGWRKGEAYALKNKGEALRYSGDVKKALINHQVALSIFEQIEDPEGIVSLLSNIGIAHYLLSDFPKAFEYYSKALKLHQENHDQVGILKNLSLIGVLYYTFLQYDGALEYYEKALKIAKDLDSEPDIAIQLGNIGLTLIKLERFSESIPNFETALFLFESNNDYYNYSVASGNIGIAYSKLKNFPKALKHYFYALNHSIKIGNSYGIAAQYGNIGELKFEYYMDVKDISSRSTTSRLLQEAEEYLVKSIEEHKNLGSLEYQRYYTGKLAAIYKERGNYKKALEYYEEVTILQDSIYSTESNKRIAELQVQQNLELKEMEIEILNKENDYQKLIKIILFGIALILIVVSIIMYSLYSNKRKHNILLEANIKDRITAEDLLKKNEFELNKHKNNLEMVVGKRTEELEKEITERKRTEEDLLVAIDRVEAANKAKSVFLENMSHELRTPLVGILGYSNLLSSEVPTRELQDMAEGINRTGNRLLNTLSMVLDLARIESDKFEINITEIDVATELTEIYNNFKGAVAVKNIDFSLTLSANPKKVYTDSGMFKVIIENLVNNAIKFTKSGKINIESTFERDATKDFLIVNVIDTGIGIRKNELPIIFNEFKQLSEGTLKDFQGSGLGLSISKKFTEHLNGTLKVESEFGSGSKFSVKFPITL